MLTAGALLAGLTLPGGDRALAGPPNDPDHDRLPSAFELRRSHTDPQDPDTDGDGIRDGAEDPDGDRLSNAGEWRFRTNPLDPDSDGIAPDDWNRDSDQDGLPDGRTQDRGPVPADLLPSLPRAGEDRPISYRDGCHLRTTNKPKRCFYGDTTSATTVVLFGDSHAAHWLPALIEIGERRSWRILSITKSGCPAPAVKTRPGYPDRCAVWRANALALIREVQPQLVLASGYGGYSLFDGSGRVSETRWQSVWREGWETILRKLKARAEAVLLLGDTPAHRSSVAGCLMRNRSNVAACTTARDEALLPAVRAAEKAAARSQQVRRVRASLLVCPYDPCPVLVDSFLIFIDRSHLTATYSTILAPGLEQTLPGSWGPQPSPEPAPRETGVLRPIIDDGDRSGDGPAIRYGAERPVSWGPDLAFPWHRR